MPTMKLIIKAKIVINIDAWMNGLRYDKNRFCPLSRFLLITACIYGLMPADARMTIKKLKPIEPIKT